MSRRGRGRTPRQSDALDSVISAIHARRCNGWQINIMDISKVFAAGHAAHAAGLDVETAVVAKAAALRQDAPTTICVNPTCQTYFCPGCSDLPPANSHAECGVCGRNKPVCCDDGYTENEDGTVTHLGAVCRDCCIPHEGVIWDGRSVAGGTYERCE